MRLEFYNLLVNRYDGIRLRYHRMHDGASGRQKILSWLYLLWMNLANLITFVRAYKSRPEEKQNHQPLPLDTSESQLHLKNHPDLSVEAYVKKLAAYDLISFDIFDISVTMRNCSSSISRV